MRVQSFPRDQHGTEMDAFLIEGSWAEIAYVLKWSQSNCSAYWESEFVPTLPNVAGMVRYRLEFRDERDAIFFKMMWHGNSFSEVA